MRHLKQFFYGIFYLTLIAGIGSASYYAFIRPAPSCFDNAQNQNEEGIDCGGICSKMCIPALAPLASADPNFIVLPYISSTTRVSFLTEIRNPNLEWAAKDFIYSFKAYDEGGNEVASYSGSSFVYAGEIKYIVSANVPASGTPKSVKVKMESPQWVKKADFEKPQLRTVLSDTNFDQVISSRGSITNDGALPANVDLIAIYYDQSGELLGVAPSYLERVMPLESRDFAIFHPVLEGVSLESTRILSNGYYIKGN